VLIVVSFNVNTCAGIHWVNTKRHEQESDAAARGCGGGRLARTLQLSADFARIQRQNVVFRSCFHINFNLFA
jgi:hypothetical protein